MSWWRLLAISELSRCTLPPTGGRPIVGSAFSVVASVGGAMDARRVLVLPPGGGSGVTTAGQRAQFFCGLSVVLLFTSFSGCVLEL